MGYIKHPAVASHLMVLFNLRAVVQRHIPTAKIDHFRAKGEMQVIQRRALSHGFLLPGVAKVRAVAFGPHALKYKACSRVQQPDLKDRARASLPALTLVLVGLLPVIGLIRRSARRIG